MQSQQVSGGSKGLSWVIDTLKIIVGRRWPLIAVLFAVEIVLIVGVANLAFFPSELDFYETQYNNLVPILNASAAGQVSGIFANNFKVATAELIPGGGLAIFGLSMYETARIVEVIGTIKGVGAGFAVATLFFLPSTWLELPAYAIAATEGVYLVYAVVGLKHGRARFVREIRFLLVTLLLIAGALAVAALFEVSEIQISSGSPTGGVYALLTWLPFAALLAGVLVFWRRARRDAPELEARDAAKKVEKESGPGGSGSVDTRQDEKGSAGGLTPSHGEDRASP